MSVRIALLGMEGKKTRRLQEKAGGRRDAETAKFFQRTPCPQERDSMICNTPVLAQWQHD